jgi:hypothetical protein
VNSCSLLSLTRSIGFTFHIFQVDAIKAPPSVLKQGATTVGAGSTSTIASEMINGSFATNVDIDVDVDSAKEQDADGVVSSSGPLFMAAASVVFFESRKEEEAMDHDMNVDGVEEALPLNKNASSPVLAVSRENVRVVIKWYSSTETLFPLATINIAMKFQAPRKVCRRSGRNHLA